MTEAGFGAWAGAVVQDVEAAVLHLMDVAVLQGPLLVEVSVSDGRALVVVSEMGPESRVA